MSRKTKKKENYLDYIPKHNSLIPFQEKDNGRIEVKKQNKGLFNGIAHLIFRRPKYSYIELDDFGSFIWKQIDGSRSIYDIGVFVKAQYGESAEPLYERLIKFLHILRSNGFIVYVNLQNKNKKEN